MSRKECKYTAGTQQIFLSGLPHPPVICAQMLSEPEVMSLSWKMKCFARLEGEKHACADCGFLHAASLTKQEASECC